MSPHGPAQLELIRRYARTLRELHADAMAHRPSTAVEREGRIVRETAPPREPVRKAVSDRTQPAP
jgi:hypothetical protein